MYFMESNEPNVSLVETLSSSDIRMIFVAKSSISMPRISTGSRGPQLFVLLLRGYEEVVTLRELGRSLRLHDIMASVSLVGAGNEGEGELP